MAFALRYGSRDYPLSPGQFVIGRSEGCQLCLTDPMASRKHAVITVQSGVLKIEDLGSRNGVVLNQELIQQPELLKHGDIIRIGSQEMTIVQRRIAGAETLAQSPTKEGFDAFGLLGSLADKALALGHGEEAERILGRQLEHMLDQALEGESSLADKTFEQASRYAFRIASLTRKGKWLDYLFQLYGSAERLMDAELVNELYSLCPRVTGAQRAQLRAYVQALGEQSVNFGPSERFILNRLEGLERQL